MNPILFEMDKVLDRILAQMRIIIRNELEACVLAGVQTGEPENMEIAAQVLAGARAINRSGYRAAEQLQPNDAEAKIKIQVAVESVGTPLHPDKIYPCSPDLVVLTKKILEPFDASDLAAAAGCTRYRAMVIMTSWTSCQWLSRHERGSYLRTQMFGMKSKDRKKFLASVGSAIETATALPPLAESARNNLDKIQSGIGFPADQYTKPIVAVETVSKLIHKPKPVEPTGDYGTNQKVTPSSAEGVRIGHTLQEPFSPSDVAARLDDGNSRYSLWIADWKARGWIATVGFMIYKRTESFGQSKTK